MTRSAEVARIRMHVSDVCEYNDANALHCTAHVAMGVLRKQRSEGKEPASQGIEPSKFAEDYWNDGNDVVVHRGARPGAITHHLEPLGRVIPTLYALSSLHILTSHLS